MLFRTATPRRYLLVNAEEEREKGGACYFVRRLKIIMVPPSRSICHKPAGFLEKTSDAKIRTLDV